MLPPLFSAQVAQVIVIGEKTRLKVVPTLHNVQRDTIQMYTCATRNQTGQARLFSARMAITDPDFIVPTSDSV